MPRSHRPTLAICYWSPYLALAVMDGNEVIAIERVKVTGRRMPSVLRTRAARLSASYRVRRVIVEPRLARAAREIRPTRETLSVAEAKRILIGRERPTHRELYRHMIDRVPTLRRLVTIRKTHRLTFTEPWRTVALLAAALCVAADTSTH